ncbi:MAG TPA: hypothetical protein VG345_05480, partial [Bryobacteraceae bacterium]|nr:hypothetical protein [Bryobacteraceae bacterium]
MFGAARMTYADSYSFTAVEIPGASQIALSGINDAGQIAGSYTDSGGQHAFVDTNGVMTVLNYPGAEATFAWGINNAGVVVGDAYTTQGTAGFVYQNGNLIPFTRGPPMGINNTGGLVGGATYVQPNGNLRIAGFLDDNGVFSIVDFAGAAGGYGLTPLAINDSGLIAGVFQDPQKGPAGVSGFVDDNGQY